MSRTASPTALTQTQLSGADAVLPPPYSGIVVHGDQKGRTIGYPTANLVCANGAIPHGVYATRCTIGTNTYSAMTFVGRKDAALGADQRVLVESHLFDASFDMYGQSIEVQFVKFIRPPVPVQSFTQLEQMLKQDERDCRHTLALWEAETGISSATPTA